MLSTIEYIWLRLSFYYAVHYFVLCSHVFLNPYPFGAGITSSEAIAMCVPVVTVVEPRQPRSVLHFALAQVRYGFDKHVSPKC